MRQVHALFLIQLLHRSWRTSLMNSIINKEIKIFYLPQQQFQTNYGLRSENIADLSREVSFDTTVQKMLQTNHTTITWACVNRDQYVKTSKMSGQWNKHISVIIIIITINYATKILNTETDSKCRLCQQFDETIDHIISACPILAKEQCIKRHDGVCAHLHFNICKETEVQLDKKHWYEHVPKSLQTSQEGRVTILWNQQVQTDRTGPNNKPDIIIRDNEKGTCMLIAVAISGDRNVIKK